MVKHVWKLGAGLAATLLVAHTVLLGIPEASAQSADPSRSEVHAPYLSLDFIDGLRSVIFPSDGKAHPPSLSAIGKQLSERTMQLASGILTFPYAGLKTTLAAGGGAVGSLVYLFSGQNLAAAQAVWVPTIYGDYYIDLTNYRPPHFIGLAKDGINK